MFGVQMSVQQTFTAIGKAKASLFIACLRKVIPRPWAGIQTICITVLAMVMAPTATSPP
mgnify:CR=1 FL=1